MCNHATVIRSRPLRTVFALVLLMFSGLFLGCEKEGALPPAKASEILFLLSEGSADKKLPNGQFLSHQTFALSLVNSGVEPRVIQGMTIRVDGRPVNGWKAMSTSMGDSPWDFRYRTRLEPGEALDPGRQIDLFHLQNGDPSFQFARLEIDACVCTAEAAPCWNVRLKQRATSSTQIESCAMAARLSESD